MRILPTIRLFVIFITALLFFSHTAFGQELFRTKAKTAYLIEAETGSVLFALDENKPVPPASLAKLMTMEMVFHAIRSGRLTLDDEFSISEYAWRTGGAASRTSTMFAKLNSSIRLEDLIKGAIVQSGNDACIAIAEGMAGSEGNFALQMTERARKLGLKQSVFANSTGLPHEAAQVTMRELVFLARHIQQTYPEFYSYYSLPDFTWGGIRQRNRNPLLGAKIGVDGLKTGFTEASGYAIVSSIKSNGKRLFLAMSGLASKKERAQEARKMLEWGARSFERKTLFKKGSSVGFADVFGGADGDVSLIAKKAIDIFVPLGNSERLKARIVYNWPLKAPIKEGARIATLKVWIGDTLSQETPLYAEKSVEKGAIHSQAIDALQELLLFWL